MKHYTWFRFSSRTADMAWLHAASTRTLHCDSWTLNHAGYGQSWDLVSRLTLLTAARRISLACRGLPLQLPCRAPQSRRYPWNKTNKLARAQTHSRASNFKLSYISPTTAAVLETGHWKILGLFVRHDCTNQQLYSLRCNLPQLPPTLTQLGLANASFSAKSVWRESKKRPVSAPRSWISRYLD